VILEVNKLKYVNDSKITVVVDVGAPFQIPSQKCVNKTGVSFCVDFAYSDPSDKNNGTVFFDFVKDHSGHPLAAQLDLKGDPSGPIAAQYFDQLFNLNKWQLGTHQQSCADEYVCPGTVCTTSHSCSAKNNTMFTCVGTLEKNYQCNGTKSKCTACGTTTCSTDGKGACNLRRCASVADMLAQQCMIFPGQTVAIPFAIPCTDPLALVSNKYTNINPNEATPSWYRDGMPYFDSEWNRFFGPNCAIDGVPTNCSQVAFGLPAPDGFPSGPDDPTHYCVHEPGPEGHHCVNFAFNHSCVTPCVGCAGGTHGGCQDASTKMCYPAKPDGSCMVDPPGCADALVDQKNWTDSTGKNGNGCGVYAYCDGTPGHCAKDLNWCEAYGTIKGASGLDPNQACCACGGGSSANQTRQTSCGSKDSPTYNPYSPCFNESLYTLSKESAVPVQTLCTTLNLTNCSFISFEVSVPIPNSQPGSPTPAPGPAPPTPAPPGPTPTPAPPGPAPTPVPGGQCTGCIGGSKGECKAASNVCFPATAGACPAGTTHC
jgi:hypothetical protein